MRQSVMPSSLRAAVRCDMPRRSSARTSRRVSPEGRRISTRVEHRVNRVGPVRRGQQRIAGIPRKQLVGLSRQRRGPPSNCTTGNAHGNFMGQSLSPSSTSIVPPHTSQRGICFGAVSTSLDRPHEKQYTRKRTPRRRRDASGRSPASGTSSSEVNRGCRPGQAQA